MTKKVQSTNPLTSEQIRELLKEGAECRKDVEARLKRMHQKPEEVASQRLQADNQKREDRITKLERDLEYALDRIARLERLLLESSQED